jgi:DsbC/DsbD-like thiol-disulfide interchange protein
MIATIIRQLVRLAAFGPILAGAPSLAADASPWTGDARAGMRLIAGRAAPDGTLRAGVEIKLGPGWKTYWRYPGDSGVPPRFDFAQSRNVRAVTVQWPAPHLFSDDSGKSIGYKSGLILPLQIVPEDPGQPVELTLKLDYAICEKLCVPAEARAKLTLSGATSAFEAALAAAEARVPVLAGIGDGAFAIRAVKQDKTGDRPRVLVDVAASDPVNLLAEGPTPDWALPVPEPVAGAAPGLRRFAFDLDGLPTGASATGAVLRLTLISATAAIEVSTPLD